jgi:hypothetical protein
LFVAVKSIDITHMEKDPAYFGEALALCHQWGLIPFITFNKDYDAEIVAQFYATVHFHANEERSMSWMTGGRRLKVDWKNFMDCLGIADEGVDNPVGLRPHKDTPPTHKSKLIRYSRTVTSSRGVTRTELIPFLDIMHRIFRNTLCPRIGNLDQVHSYLVDLLLLCIKEKGKESTLDISHIMWHELRSAVLDRKVPIYGPYLFTLIEKTWAAQFPGEALPTEHMVSHGVLSLRQKENWGTAPAAPGEEIAPLTLMMRQSQTTSLFLLLRRYLLGLPSSSRR